MRSALKLTLVAGILFFFLPQARAGYSPVPDVLARVKLPGTADRIDGAGGGKFLLLHLMQQHQLAVVDVAARKLITALPIPDDAVFAGGLDKLFVVDPALSQIQRYDLGTMKLEQTSAAPRGKPKTMVIGGGSTGPLLMSTTEALWVVDPVTMAATKFPFAKWTEKGPDIVDVSYDGSLVSGWGAGEVFEVKGGRFIPVDDKRPKHRALGNLRVSGDGSMLFPVKGGAVHSDRTPVEPKIEGEAFPTDDVRYSLVRQGGDAAHQRLGLVSNSEQKIIYWLADLPELNQPKARNATDACRLIPSQKVLVLLTPGGDELVVRQFDLTTVLTTAKPPPVVVAPPPPTIQTPTRTPTPTPAPTPTAPGVAAAPRHEDPSAAETVVRFKLPATADAINAGGGGKYLLLHLSKLHMLAVFDVSGAKISKYIPLRSDEIFVAAGAEKLFVAFKDLNQVERYDLATGQLELTVPAPEGGIEGVATGEDAAGPVLIFGKAGFWQLDPVTMSATRFASRHWDGKRGGGHGPDRVGVCFDGSTAMASGGGWDGTEVCILTPGGPVEVPAASGHEFNGDGRLSGDGELILPEEGSPLHADQSPADTTINARLFPADDPLFSMAFHAGDGHHTTLTFFCNSDPKPIFALRDLPELDFIDRDKPAKYVRVIPSQNALVTLNKAGDELSVRRFDLQAHIEASPLDYFFVESKTVQTAVPGTPYSSVVTVRSRKPGVRMELQAGPPGMTLSADGTLSWAVPAGFSDPHPAVIIQITNSANQSIFHSFVIQVRTPVAPAEIKPVDSSPVKPTAPAGKSPVPGPTSGQNPPKPAVKPTPAAVSPATDGIVIDLPHAYSDFAAAGGGHELVLFDKESHALDVYDTATGKRMGSIPVAGDDMQFACGRDAIVIAFPSTRLLERYDLKTLQRINMVSMPDTRPLHRIKMGCDSTGPVYLEFQGQVFAVDGATVAKLPPAAPVASGSVDYWFDFRVSADGHTLTTFEPAIGPASFHIVRFRDGTVENITSSEQSSMGNRQYTPTADGRFVFYETTIYDSAANRVAAAVDGANAFVPTADPRFFLAVKQTDGQKGVVSLCTANNRRAIAALPGIDDIGDGNPGDPRVIFLPDSQTITQLPKDNKRLLIRKIDLSPKPGGAIPAVISLPPMEASVGGQYSYQIELLPAGTPATFKVESGPPGLTVSPTGLVSWKPADRPVGGTADVIVGVVLAPGQELTHSFTIAVTRGSPGPAGETPVAPGIVKLDEHRIELPDGESKYIQGLGGHALILSGRQLAVVAADGFTIQKQLVLPKAYTGLAERKDYYVRLCQSPRSIDVIDKTTLKVSRSRPIAFNQLIDVALNPTLPVSYVSYTQQGDLPVHHFLMFDEATAEAHTDDNWIGQWLAAGPDGKFLMSGFQETYRSGSDIIQNPDRDWIVPTFGSIDSMQRYDLDEATGIPVRVIHTEKVGGNGTGIRLSADGKRATFLSVTGFPEGSKDLAGWDVGDLRKLPVTYATKDAASTNDLAFHPVLPLVACYGKGTVVFFDRETGERQTGRINDAELADQNIDAVWFSPDGKSIILGTTVKSVRYLYHLPLKLSAAEQEQVDRLPLPPPEMKQLQPPDGPPTKRKLEQTQA